MASNPEDLLKELENLGAGDQPGGSNSTTGTGGTNADDEDPFADIQKQLASKPATTPASATVTVVAGTGSSRPATPRLSSSTTSAGTNKSPKRSALVDHTPASSGPPSGRSSEDRLRAVEKEKRPSGERSYHQAFVPEDDDGSGSQEKKTESGSSGGGWWGSMFSAATAAVKQAETIAKEIRGNEEAMKWAESVRGYGANLQNLSTDIRSRALPTFTSLVAHIAPPISAHERLQVHITHDIQNYPSLDPLIYDTFSRVMSQVEGGDLLVIQRGTESRAKGGRSSGELQGYRGGVLGGSNRWTDGPWWRDELSKRQLGIVPGLKEGTRLARVSAESYAKDIFDSRGGLEEAAKKATEAMSSSNPVRSSDIFLAIQPLSFAQESSLFAEAAASSKAPSPDAKPEPTAADPVVVDPGDDAEEQVAFAVYLYDPIHSLSFSTLSQPFPLQWANWLDASSTGTDADGQPALPESIMEIIHAGSVDPREWVAEWMEELLGLAVGIVAQRYVARRMGVGLGGLGRGKMRLEEVGIGGEAARAI